MVAFLLFFFCCLFFLLDGIISRVVRPLLVYPLVFPHLSFLDFYAFHSYIKGKKKRRRAKERKEMRWWICPEEYPKSRENERKTLGQKMSNMVGGNQRSENPSMTSLPIHQFQSFFFLLYSPPPFFLNWPFQERQSFCFICFRVSYWKGSSANILLRCNLDSLAI